MIPTRTQHTMRQISRILLAMSLALSASCARQAVAGEEQRTSPRQDLITRDEMTVRYYPNAYELIAALRPNWFNVRGVETLGTPIELQVHYNGVHVGGIAMLREISVGELQYLEYIDPNAASARWGLGYGKGAVMLSTKPK
jgi:hypothetical protein